MLSQLGRTQLSPTFLGGWMSGIDGFSMSSGLFRFPRARTYREKRVGYFWCLEAHCRPICRGTGPWSAEGP